MNLLKRYLNGEELNSGPVSEGPSRIGPYLIAGIFFLSAALPYGCSVSGLSHRGPNPKGGFVRGGSPYHEGGHRTKGSALRGPDEREAARELLKLKLKHKKEEIEDLENDLRRKMARDEIERSEWRYLNKKLKRRKEELKALKKYIENRE